MSEPLKPALTPEEWVKLEGPIGKEGFAPFDIRGGLLYLPDSYMEWAPSNRERHALAALCLHEQPFGFTRNDVRLLNALVCTDRAWMNARKEILDLIARIEALLPPEQP